MIVLIVWKMNLVIKNTISKIKQRYIIHNINTKLIQLSFQSNIYKKRYWSKFSGTDFCPVSDLIVDVLPVPSPFLRAFLSTFTSSEVFFRHWCIIKKSNTWFIYFQSNTLIISQHLYLLFYKTPIAIFSHTYYLEDIHQVVSCIHHLSVYQYIK